MTEQQYDVALSFAGEQREYVQGVATALEAAGVRHFFDERAAADMWGEDLVVYLDRVYRRGARFVVVFVSAAYAEKVWPRVEFRSALARAIEEKGAYILPVRFDDTALPGLLPTVGYLDARRMKPEEIAQTLLQKLGTGSPSAVVPDTTRVPRVPPADFNPYAESERSVVHIRSELAKRMSLLEGRGFAVHAQERNGRFIFRVMRSGQTVYGLDVWIGSAFGDNTICFATGTRISSDANTTNGTATVEWDRDRGMPIIKTFNMSILREMGREYRLTPAEFVDELWEAICQQLERTQS